MRITTLAFLALAVAGCTATVSTSTEPSPSGEACAASGCALAIETQPSPGSNDVCQVARIGGVLTADPTYGLGVRDDSGLVHGVLWPYGYSARREPGGIVPIDRSGRIVAREGDNVVMGGVVNADGVHWPCYEPYLEVVRPGQP